MKIYTKTGDSGTTSLFDGTRVSKDDLRVEVYGDVDELNAWLGVVLSSVHDQDINETIQTIQNDLFALGAHLANPAQKRQKDKTQFSDTKVLQLERWIDSFESKTKPTKNFILPGGSLEGSHFHFARTVCRRAERKMVTLSKKEAVGAVFLTYMNRLSDLLFVLARVMNQRSGIQDIPWMENKS